MSLEEFLNYREREPNETEDHMDERILTQDNPETVDVQPKSIYDVTDQDAATLEQELNDLLESADPELIRIVDAFNQIKDIDYTPQRDLVEVVPNITVSDSSSESLTPITDSDILNPSSFNPSETPKKRRGRPVKGDTPPNPVPPVNEPHNPLSEQIWIDPYTPKIPTQTADSTNYSFGVRPDEYHRNKVQASVTVTLTGSVNEIMRVLALIEEATNGQD